MSTNPAIWSVNTK